MDRGCTNGFEGARDGMKGSTMEVSCNTLEDVREMKLEMELGLCGIELKVRGIESRMREQTVCCRGERMGGIELAVGSKWHRIGGQVRRDSPSER